MCLCTDINAHKQQVFIHSFILMYLLFMCMSVYDMWRSEGGTGCPESSYGWLWAVMKVLEMEPKSSARTSAFTCWAIPPAPINRFKMTGWRLWTPIKSLNSETKRLRNFQSVWATKGNPGCKQKTHKDCVMALHLFFLTIKHFHDKKNYGTFCLVLERKSQLTSVNLPF